MNKRKQGMAYEAIAARYLKEHGLKILEKNYRVSKGEVDLIALDGEVLVFVEVKYRKNTDWGYPWEAVSLNKQRRLCHAAQEYCYRGKLELQCRYDVISICGEEIEWFQNAFFHQEQRRR